MTRRRASRGPAISKGPVTLALSAALVALCTGCGPDKPGEDAPDHGVDPNLRIGHVMVEVGHRIEMAGRAAEASNWGLAGYEVEETLEIFNMDMTRSALPGVCNDSISDAMYENLLDELPELRGAAEREDVDGFAARFATVSSSCNGCHAGCNVAFIRVPDRPGAAIPMIASDPRPVEPEEQPAEAQ